MTTEDFFKQDETQLLSMNPEPYLMALWHDYHGNWDTAHEFVQDDPSAKAAWVHAYLHRREGDTGNAAYWYKRAKRPVCTESLDQERAAIALELLP
jgi:hypothetical protein